MGFFKFCRCGVKIPYSQKYCEECEVKAEEQKKKRLEKLQEDQIAKKNAQDNYRKQRWKEGQDFYQSKEWIRLRDSVKANFKGMCVLCYFNDGTAKPSDVVHHIKEIRKSWDKRLDRNNLICLCGKCHSFVHYQYLQSIHYHLTIIVIYIL